MVTLLNKHKLKALMESMQGIFPGASMEQQEQYEVARHYRLCRWFSRGFSVLFLFLILTYNMFHFAQYFVMRFLMRSPNARRTMPYTPVSPWDWSDNLGYYALYTVQALGGYTSILGHITTNLLIYTVSIQVIMHFDYLNRQLVEFKLQSSYAKEMRQLKRLIFYHNELLELVPKINEVFGLPLLLNFMTSSLVVCFVGFQMTITLSPQFAMKLFLFLISALVEIFLICYFSDKLMMASLKVASSVYEMNWLEAEPRFRRMLVLMILRAQRPVHLTATAFLSLSMQTMTTLVRKMDTCSNN
ncbi:odorant receptor 67a-like [Drosophila busckii]|uniref:odorant receptor 67a-like n=1 Tax=Drosophila busckii TaxID=30019 RepID=UPI001432F280|nr:odorant receptor 67a-like [Drosophila busckii]